MKLSQMFTGQTQAGEVLHREETHVQQMTRNTAAINRQIRSLVPGQTISGEIVGRNGGEVQIKLADDMVLNARVDRSLNIEVGKNMTFEVKNNGSSLTLSPLFTNVATDVNVLKALDMAGLPVNQASVEMTEKLMAAGLPVNRNTLLQVYREVNSFPQVPISDVVDLHRLQMPVNEANLNQLASYRNLTHQLLQGMETVADALPEVFESMQEAGDAAGAVKLYHELFMLVQEGSGEGQELAETVSVPEATVQQGTAGQEDVVQNTVTQDSALQSTTEQGIVTGQENINIINEDTQALNLNSMLTEFGAVDGQAAGDAAIREQGMAEVPEALRAAASEEVLSMVKELPLTEQQMEEVVRQVNQFAAGEIDASQFIGAMNRLVKNLEASQNTGVSQNAESQNISSMQNDGLTQHNETTLITENHDKAMRTLAEMFSQPSFKKLLNGQLKKMWTISPKDVAEPRKIEELYHRLDRQLKGLSNALENAGQADSAAYKAASNMSQNMDFLQQINQMYAYVQLPLRMQQGEAHGDLYVYTNKKHLARADGKVSALLHLDMEHLGPVDVYVTLQNSKVNTNFRVRDDDMLEFLSEHMDLLTERLKKRGYDCSYSMTTKGEIDNETAESGIAPILQQEKGIALAQYAFDVRT